MKHLLSHKITNPCEIAWEDMLPTEHGKYCLNCKKEVFDLSEMSDNELVTFLYHHQGKSFCSRMTEEQTQKTYTYIQPQINSSPVQKYVALFLAGLAVVGSASAQSIHPKTTTEISPANDSQNLNLKTKTRGGSNIISGTLINADSKMPLRTMSLALVPTELIRVAKEELDNIQYPDDTTHFDNVAYSKAYDKFLRLRDIKTTTDENGYFEFVLPPEVVEAGNTTLFIQILDRGTVRNANNQESYGRSYGFAYPTFTIEYKGVSIHQNFEVKKQKKRITYSLGMGG